MNKILNALLAAAFGLAAIAPAQASLYTTSYGTKLDGPSDCDDCHAGPVAFSGTGQSIAFFGNTYNSLFVGSNGYVTFGGGYDSYSTAPLDTQTIAPMIAGLYTDLDTRNDNSSNVYVNTSTNGEIVITWENVGHYSQNYSGRSTFQIVIRSDQAVIPTGQGQIGFFYGNVGDTHAVSAGFGDGLAASNPGEVAFASFVDGTTLSNNATRFYDINNGVPVDTPSNVPEPTSLSLLGIGLAGYLAKRRRKAS